MRVLIADDNDDSLEMLRAALEGYGYEVEAARDGYQALEQARQKKPDMIISDIMMPRLDGFAFCRAAKADQLLRDIPFIFYTATYVDSADEKLALSLGAARYLLKPLEPERFHAVILDELARVRATEPEGTPAVEKAAIDEMYSTALARKLEKKVRELEQERTEVARKEAWLTSLLSIAPCAIICFEPDGTILQLNQEAKRLLLLDKEEPAGRLCREMFGFSTTTEPAECMRLLAESLPITGFETRLRNGKEERIVAWNMARLASPRGELAGIVAVGYDMTHFHLAEEESCQLREQLNRAQRLESLGRLAGGIAHDFNNLLTPIMGCADIAIRKAASSPGLTDSLKMIVEAAARAKDMTAQLLSFSRKQVLQKKTLDLNIVLLEFEKLLNRLVPANIAISIKPAPYPVKVLVDRSQIEQILLNLAVNSADAMPEGGIFALALSVAEAGICFTRARLEGAPEDYLLLTVSDTGCGIQAGDMSQIFEPFFTTKVIGKGTGLGLATVYGIVKQHGGSITAESPADGGTIFRIFLPFAEKAESAADITATACETISGKGETILIAEDHDMVREVTAMMLKETGFRVITAPNAEEAMRIASEEQGRIDLLLTDVVMTGLDGGELHRRLRTERPGLKVLFMSGYADSDLLGSILQEYAENFILKPFSHQALTAKIRDILTQDECED